MSEGTFIVEYYCGAKWQDATWTEDNGAPRVFNDAAQAQLAIDELIENRMHAGIAPNPLDYRAVPRRKSDHELAIDHLAGANVSGRLRAILSDVEAGEIVLAVDKLADLITRVEQRDVQAKEDA